MSRSGPLLFVISGPSGAGKGTALRHLSATFSEIERVTTFTTRKPRPNETPGVDYRYIDEAEFERLRESGEIYESERTYKDYAYGSPSCLLRDDAPAPMLVEMEVKGMLRLRASSRRRVVSIFLLPAAMRELAERVESRHAEGNLDARMEVALEQVHFALAYDYLLVNADREDFLRDLTTVVQAELLRSRGIEVAMSSAFRFG